MTKSAFGSLRAVPYDGPTRKRSIAQTLLALRLTFFLLTVALFSINARTMAQKVTISGDNLTFKQVFTTIKKQTGYVVFGNRELLDSKETFPLKIRDMPLRDLLDQLLKDRPFDYTISSNSILISRKTPASPPSSQVVPANRPAIITPVTGQVVNASGIPIPGATVRIQRNKNGMATNNEGRFSLTNVEEGTLVEVSAIGFAPLSLRFHAGSFLSVSAGPQIVTSSFKVVPSNQQPGSGAGISLIITLSKVINPLDEVKIIAYGTTTTRYSTGSLSTISAAEIERQPVTNVLAALEGRVPGLQISQATGMPGGNFTVKLRGVNSLNGNVDPLYVVDGVPFPSTSLTKLADLNAAQFSSPLNEINPNDIQSITVLKDAAATAIYGARGANGVILITMKKGISGSTKVNVNMYTGIGQNYREKPMMNTTEYLAAHREALQNDGQTPTAANAPDLVLWDPNAYTDWQKKLLGYNAIYKDVQASVSGGSGGTRFLVGAGYHQESTNFSSDPAVKKIALNFSIGHTSENNRFNMSLTGNYMNDRTLLPAADPAVTAATLKPNRPPLEVDGVPDLLNGSNPITGLLRPYHAERDNLVASGSLSYLILPGLTIKSTFGYNTITSNEMQLIPLSTFVPGPNVTSGNSTFADNRLKTWNIEPQITYDRTIGKGRLSALLGSTIQSGSNHGVRYAASGFVNDAFLADIQAAKTVTVSALTDGINKFNSYFARINYTWDEKYIVDLTGRRDGSSRFGDGNKYGNFGAAGVAWIFSKENIVASALPFLSFGKLRLSYGSVGNAPATDYNYLSQWGTISTAYDGIGGLYPLSLHNPGFAWETTIKKEAGLDLEFFNGRLVVNADYYLNRSSNQLVNYILPYMTGFPSIYANSPAVIQNNGWEFTLQSANIQSRPLTWTTSFNFSAPRNKLVAFDNLASSTYSGTYIIGQPVYIKQLTKYVDVDPATGYYRFQGPSGPVSSPPAGSPKVLFDPTPRYYGGVGNNFKYKGFELDFFFAFTKQKALNNDGFTSNPSTNLPVRYLDRWRKPGDISQNQLLTSNFTAFLSDSQVATSDKNLVDASFIRLKNVSLCYNIPTRYMQRIHFKSGRIYFQGQNLATITSFQGLDPETGNSNMALLRVMTAGLQFTL